MDDVTTRDRVLIVHPDLNEMGGIEVFAMHLIDAIQRKYNVSLLSIEHPDFEELNEFAGTSVEPSTLEFHSVGGYVPTAQNAITNKTGRLHRLRNALISRHLSKHEYDVDLIFSVYNELFTHSDGPTIQYIHQPLLNRSVLSDLPGSDSSAYRLYDGVCGYIEGQTSFNGRTTVLVNSKWMKPRIASYIDIEPTVLCPPIDVSRFESSTCKNSWENRDYDFISVGRISREKNLIRNIEILDDVRRRGHNLNYRIVGPRGNKKYYEELKKEVMKHDFVTLDGRVSRNELVSFLQNSKYGIHGKKNEHFGIAVGEMVAAGVIPFVPNSGGQQELVGGLDSIIYKNKADCANKICRLCSSETLQTEVYNSLPDIQQEFGIDRFREQILEIISDKITA